MYRILLLIFCYLFSVASLVGQTDTFTSTKPYTRVGITPVLMKRSNIDAPFSIDSSFRSLQIPQKFDPNPVRNSIISTPFPPYSYELPSHLKALPQPESEDDSEEEESLAGALAKAASEGITQLGGLSISKSVSLGQYDSLVRSNLHQEYLPLAIIDSLFNEDSTGRYSMDKLVRRAKYNLTDAEIVRLRSTAKRLEGSIRDAKWIKRILTSNYIISFDFHDIRTMEEVYDKIDAYRRKKARENDDIPFKPIERKYRGYEADVTAYVYHLNLNDSVRAAFYNNCWAGPDSDPQALKSAKESRENMRFPVRQAKVYQFGIRSRQQKSDESENSLFQSRKSDKELFQVIPQKALDHVLKKLEEDIDDFKVQTSVFDSRELPYPKVWAKIGTKEGLNLDDRYFVYEYVQGTDGEINKERRGVVRANNVVKNDTIATGGMNPSKFVQTAGGGLGKGMLMQQNVDKGFALGLTWLNQAQNFLNLRASMRLSKISSARPGWHLYGEVGLGLKTFEDEIKLPADEDGAETYSDNVVSYKYGFGIGKELYFLHHFQLIPYLGFHGEYSKFTNSDLHDYVSEEFEDHYGSVLHIDAGLRLSVNIKYNLKVVGSFGFSPINYSTKSSFYGPSYNSDATFGLPDGSNTYYLERNPYKWDVGIKKTF